LNVRRAQSVSVEPSRSNEHARVKRHLDEERDAANRKVRESTIRVGKVLENSGCGEEFVSAFARDMCPDMMKTLVVVGRQRLYSVKPEHDKDISKIVVPCAETQYEAICKKIGVLLCY